MDGSEVTQRLLNDYQRNFPLEARPFARIAEELGIGEDGVLSLLSALLEAGKLGRVGAIVRPNSIGASTLCAMRVPPERLEAVAAVVARRPEVNHAYEREHDINFWFVVTACDRAGVLRVLEEIEGETRLATIDLPIIEPYHIDLGFDMRCR